MPAEQNFKNHTRFDPPFHFVLMPLLLADTILAGYITIRDWPMHSRSHLWWILMAFVWMVSAPLLRGYALKNQDRIIRMEERGRYSMLLSPAEAVRAHALTMRQIVALRFASDAELPSLISRALAENLSSKQIKQAIVTWRPDNDRV